MAPKDETNFEMQLSGRAIQVALLVTARVRRVNLKITREGIRILAPVFTPLTPAEAEDLVRKNAKPILSALDKLARPIEKPPAKRTLAVGKRTIAYSVRRSARAHQVILRIRNADVELVVPHGATIRDAEAFLRSKADWIVERVDSQRADAARKEDAFAEWRNTVLYRGQRLPIEVAPGRYSCAQLRDGVLRVEVNPKSSAGPASIVVHWLQAVAREDIEEAMHTRSRQMGVAPAKLFLRDNRSTWGTCSHKGNIGISWRLAMAPPEVLDAIVVHELAHMKQLNHSKAFHELVLQYCPGYAEADAWLHKNGWTLWAPIQVDSPQP